MEFEGFDWTELTIAFGLYNESDDNEIVLKKTKDYLIESYLPKANSVVADTIRAYLGALFDRCSKVGSYSTPLWRGLMQIEDDRTLIKYTVALLEYLWF